ncbi:isoleucine--tRNA ligase, cytoplasmic [Anoplolepis gracilipes]|uniref:isoleucine--tRNA ligase, cytoplasmic n=1 Tax=Anoplolepis gracilipes TaxID=354296 RepID=UPI003BA2A18D
MSELSEEEKRMEFNIPLCSKTLFKSYPKDFVMRLPESIDFAKEEEKIEKRWGLTLTEQRSMMISHGRPKYSFYDGPPFATGLPHYGHILTGTIKDTVTRYAYQSGYHVERRFGWDCHGLPVEHEVDKEYNIKGPDDVAKMGIAEYNKKCEQIVMRYEWEWTKLTERMGRWMDFWDDYKTMYTYYMESIWYIFKQLYNKGLIYKSFKVMPYSTSCNTVLSNFEAGQNYKDVVDPSVVVAFPLLDEPGVSLLAWTTTPWTLPSNLTLCVNPTLEYVEVKDNASGNVYIILETQLKLVFKSPNLYTIQGKRMGVDLKGKKYEPPFPYFIHYREKGAFKVLNDTYVTAETGTGIVHQAPYFGEDDYRCCLEAGIITKEQETLCPVDSCGCFIEPVHDFLGMYIKDADKEIIKYLKANKKLIVNSTVKHSYPFCWRTDTPLIYKAVPSWFLRVESIKDQLLAANSTTFWVPNYVKEKRFGNWLREARDWAISRNRYWGNPIPLWISDDQEEIVCVGSIQELEHLTGTKINDKIHRHDIDHLEIPSKRPGHPPLRRIPEVFDCWFESGSMPYAQVRYPHKMEEFHERFPADFIAEGIDQTRGWFYTLLVIGTALFGKAPYKNVIVNGLILASDGQKMSKRKKNYPDPNYIIDKYGADALRLYLINSPVVKGDNLRFKEEGVRDIIKEVLLPWYNAFRFLVQNISQFEKDTGEIFVFDETDLIYSNNIMDSWIVSFTQTLLVFVEKEMKKYKLYTVVPYLIKYIDNLTNWYVRMNRKRIKNENDHKDCKNALNTLFLVIYTMVRVYAPFTPFLTEYMFIWLSKWFRMKNTKTSVHFQMIPQPRKQLINENIETAVSHMQTVIELARIVRDRKTIPTKYPLREIIVIHQDPEVLENILLLEAYILEELNIKKLTVTTDKKKYGVTLRAEPDHKTLGARLKGEFKQIMLAIKELSDEQLQKFVATKEIVVQGHKLEEQDLRLMFNFTGPAAKELSNQYEAHSEGSILILLDITSNEELYNEGIAREVINRVQKLRKKANLIPSDKAIVFYDINDVNNTLAKVIVNHKEFIETTTKTPLKNIADFSPDYLYIFSEVQIIKEETLTLLLAQKQTEMSRQTMEVDALHIFLKLVGLQPRFDAALNGDTSPVKLGLFGKKFGFITQKRLKKEVDLIFGLYGCSYDLYLNNKKFTINSPQDIFNVNEQTVQVVKAGMALSSDN